LADATVAGTVFSRRLVLTAPADRVHVVIAFHGGRGHTAALAKAVRAGAEEVPHTEVIDVHVDTIAGPQWHQLDDADAIIFGAPTYMGTASAPFHAFAEASGKRWFARKWQDKLAAGFTNSGSMAGDKSGTLGYFSTFAAQHGMTWVNLGLASGWNSAAGSASDLNRLGFYQGAAAQSNVDERTGTVHESDLATARHLGRRVAELTRVLAAGRRVLLL
jgi:multimeric flavodoxin WrbA